MLIVSIIRSVVAFAILFLITHMMGKKQISQLTFFDYVIGITIGSVAATMSVDIGVSPQIGAVTMVVWGLAAVVLGWLSLKSVTLEKLINSEPTILVQDGKILEKNMGTARYSIADLLMQLRTKDCFSLADVEVAILESNGELSVLKKSDAEPVTPRTLGIAVASQAMPSVLIWDGKVMKDTLEHLGYDKDWLDKALAEQGVEEVDEVMLAQAGGYGELYVDLKDDKDEAYKPNKRKQLAADIDSVQADLHNFALQTDDIEAKKLFNHLAGRIGRTRKRVVPLLLH